MTHTSRVALKTYAIFIGFISPALSAGDSVYVHKSADGSVWTIGNTLVERQIRFAASGGLYTSAWRYKITGTDFLGEAAAQEGTRGPEFEFTADGKRLAGSWGTDFELIGSEVSDIAPAAKLLEIKLRSRAKPLNVSVFYAVYDGHPVVRKWLAITNYGTDAITLTRVGFEVLRLRAGMPEDLQVSGLYATQPRPLFYTGRVEDPAILERDSRTGEGFIVMNEAPGLLKRTEMAGWALGLEVMYDTNIFPFKRTLAPGETFTTAKSSVAFFADGRGFADPHWVMPTYTSQVLKRKSGGAPPPWIYNTWEPFGRTVDTNIAKQLIPIAAKMGFDIFTIDDGWQQEYGENTVNLKQFPGGLDEVVNEVERNGMRLGLWVPLAVISPNTEDFRQHPEWSAKGSDGKTKFTFTSAGQQAMMCLASPYQDVAAKRINELIARYHLAYVKIDLTTVFNAYGFEELGCYGQGHYHKTWAESLTRIYEAIQLITDRIYHEHPDVLLDLTFELWGEKHIIDYGLLSAGDLDWLSNVDDGKPGFAGPRSARTLLYQRSLALPVETMLIGNLHAEAPPVEERFATAIGSGPLLLGDLRKLTPAELDWYHARIRWYKKLRQEVPMDEGFFPLGSWEQPGTLTWDGFARLSRKGEGLIALFRNDATTDNAEVKLPVMPEGSYNLRSVATGIKLGTFSSGQIRQGLSLRFPEKNKTEIVELRRATSAHSQD